MGVTCGPAVSNALGSDHTAVPSPHTHHLCHPSALPRHKATRVAFRMLASTPLLLSCRLASMIQEHSASGFSAIFTTLQSWAHAAAPAGSESFEMVALFSLACHIVFAIVALHYALKTWAEKVMFTCIAGGTGASLLLHLSLLHSPSYIGEGALWKFVSLSQYLPWAVISLGGLYVLYRIWSRRIKRRC